MLQREYHGNIFVKIDIGFKFGFIFNLYFFDLQFSQNIPKKYCKIGGFILDFMKILSWKNQDTLLRRRTYEPFYYQRKYPLKN